MLKLRGIFCPIATPFDHRGELYLAKLRHNVSRLNRTRLAGYLVAGHVGEGTLLDPDEKRRLWETVKLDAADDRMLLAGVTSESVKRAVELADVAGQSGYAAVVSEPPVDYPQSDAVLYFGALADHSPLPVVIATSAARPLRRERVEALAQHPNIVGVYARGLALGDDLLESVPDGLQVLGGSERSLTDLWAAGVQAAVLPLANAIPFHLLSMDEALRTRETAAAEDLGTRAEEAFAIVWERYGPAGLKHAMDLRGYYGGAPRQPTPPLKPEAKQQIEASLDGIAG